MENIKKEPDLPGICVKTSATWFSKVFNVSSEKKNITEKQLFQHHKQVLIKAQTIHNLKTKLN